MSETVIKISDVEAKTRPRRHFSPMWQLVLARLREFIREPEAVFWTFGFPILMVVALGIAFRDKRVESVPVDVATEGRGDWVMEALADNERFAPKKYSEAEARARLRAGSTDLVVLAEPASANEEPRFTYWFNPTRPESVLARDAVNDALQRAAGRKDVATTSDQEMEQTGARYIDFLVPGLLGMSLMGGGMWGLGFVTVDMRIRKLLKRFLATPMKKSQFLGGLMMSRMMFMVPEVLILLVFAYFAFDFQIRGSLFDVLVLVLLGAVTFSGLGLLIASRANTIEAVSGLMNLVMLPMWMLSGIFFKSDRFGEAAQPFIKALPLTPLNDSLRGVMLEGATLIELWPDLLILIAWGAVSFVLALRRFRWT
jgi:ABC-2 type transport system permease protein